MFENKSTDIIKEHIDNDDFQTKLVDVFTTFKGVNKFDALKLKYNFKVFIYFNNCLDG